MLELAAAGPGETVLEVAAGPGDTGLGVVAALGPSGRLISSDVAPEMVAVAQRVGEAAGVTNAEFRVMDACHLDLEDGSVDLVLCRFGLMLIPEMEAAAVEIARVLRPGGRVVVAVWAERSRNLWVAGASTAARGLGLIEAVAEDEPGPFRLADPDRLRSVISAAGLEIDTLEGVAVDWRAASLDEWWETVSDTSPTMGDLRGRLTPDELSRVRARAEADLGAFIDADGVVDVPGLVWVVRARRG